MIKVGKPGCSTNSAGSCLWTNWTKRLLFGALSGLRSGAIRLQHEGTQYNFGEPADLECELEVHHPRFFFRALKGGSLGIAESYLDEDWTCPDLTALFRILLRNRSLSDRMGSGWARLLQFPSRLLHRLRSNTRAGSRKNIHEHYDLGNDFFSLMLDETWMYSSGIFLTERSSLYDASVEKIDRVCRKLDLRPEDQLLEIGTGWGGLAEHAARNYGCRITTTTISQEQYQFAKQRIQQAGLSDRVEILLTDYRDLKGEYDKLVSIEMIEAVGDEFLGEYFKQCSRLLKENGTMLLQGILMSEQDHAQYVRSVDFIQKYIFPGGCLPSVRSIADAVADHSDLRWAHLEDFGIHYAQTLREWKSRFESRLDEVRSLGYPERFIRMWRYYLCYCEAAFQERYIGVGQFQFDKPGHRRDPIEISRQAARTSSSIPAPHMSSTGTDRRGVRLSIHPSLMEN